MKTYSLESAFVRAYTTAAVAVQGAIDWVKTAERITRPERQPWGDVDTEHDPVRDSVKLHAEDPFFHRNEDGSLKPKEFTDESGETWTVTEREADEEVSEPVPGRYSVQVENGYPYIIGKDVKVGPRYCGPCDEEHDTPNPNEPGLTDDELVAVRGLIQERYEDRGESPPWLTDRVEATVDYAAGPLAPLGVTKDNLRQFIDRDTPPCDHRYCERQGYGLCFGVVGAQFDLIEDTSPASAPVNHTGAGAEPTVAGAVSPVPREPAPARPDLATWLEPAAHTILDAHAYNYNCACGAPGICDWLDWREHVVPLICSHIAQALPDFQK